MKLGDPIDLSPEEIAQITGAPAGSATVGDPIDLTPEEIAAFSSAPTPPGALGEPVDALDDFDVYNAIEDAKEERGYDPDDPGVAAKLWTGLKEVVAQVPAMARGVQTIGRAMFPQTGVPVRRDQEVSTALQVQTAGKVLGNASTLGQGAMTLTQKAVAKGAAIVNPELEPEMKQISRRASWEFQREARSAEQFTNQFTQHLETLFPQALRGLGAVPVDNAAANALSILADPANLFPAGAAAKWTTQVPLRGVVRAANVAVKESALEVAKAAAHLEAAKLTASRGFAAADPRALSKSVVQAGEIFTNAQQRHAQARQALVTTVASQRATVDELATEAASLPLVTRGAAAASRGIGSAVGMAGDVLQQVATLPNRAARYVAGNADDSARNAIEEGIRNVAGGFGALPAAAGATAITARNVGRNLSTYGRLLAEAEGQLPFFKRLARETDGLTSWTASLVDQSGMGQLIVPAARVAADASRGLPMAALFGYAGSGGETDGAIAAAGGGIVFGLAGGGYGQWQRHATGAGFRQRQLADVDRYRQTLPTQEVKSFFASQPKADQAALATMQLAHPDLRIQYSKLGAKKPSFYYAAEDGPVAVVNLDSKDALPAVVAHEIGHHVERHGLGAAIDRTLLGDPLLNQPGLFTKLDADGAPVKTAEGAYALSDEWTGLRKIYDDRLQQLADTTGDVVRPRTDAEMAREVFAEHAADYLLGRDGALTRDLRANVWSRALGSLAGSELTGNATALRSLLGKLGAPIAQADLRVSGSGLFPGGLAASPDLQRLISRYHRRSAQGRMPALDDEPGNTRYTAAELKSHPQILEKLFDGSDDVARTANGRVMRDKSGAPIFLTPKEQKAQRAALAAELDARLTAEPPAGARMAKVGKDVKAEEGWLTPAVPDAVLDDLSASGKFNPAQIEHLRQASRAITEGRGRSLLFFYQPALNAGKRYQSLAGDWRTETPYAIFVSKAGNVLLRTMSREKLMSNVQALVAKKRAGLWDNNVVALVADVDRYLANHAAGRPGSDGIGEAKRNQINAMFGIDTKQNASANPLIESSPKSTPILRSRRIDRLNRMAPVEEFFPTDYDRLNANLRPE